MNGLMRLTDSLDWPRKLMVLAGVIMAFLFDLTVNLRLRHIIWDFGEPSWLLWLILVLGILSTGAFWLERYVRPLSNIGALSTGFCGYALASFLWPTVGT